MGAFIKSFEKYIECPKCGKKHMLMKTTLPTKDTDILNCNCGEEIYSWHKECAMYHLEDVK